MIVVAILIGMGLLCVVMILFFITTGRKESNETELLNKLLEQGRHDRACEMNVDFEIVEPLK